MSVNRMIDQICDQFEAAWQAGQAPVLNCFLENIPFEHRSAVLQQLIPIDIEYRCRLLTCPEPEFYAESGSGAVEIAANEIASIRPTLRDPVIAAGVSQQQLSSLGGCSDANHLNRPLDSDSQSGTELRNIGPYKLLQQIGEGGMGTVYLAEQTRPVRRRVALKLIKAGTGSQAIITRFEAERQALAMMDHQNIARVLDAGTTPEGRPYFVMELVNGIAITDYCDKFMLSLEQRIGLLIQACRAIQHAHQKGIIHRDIKPSNVLVTQLDGTPVVKVIDFGLAKALQAGIQLSERTLFTEFGQVVGTLQYMSPEQAELSSLDVDTRSDVYSLGILLYELLTGSTPIERATLKKLAFDLVLKAIREEEAPRPSARLSSLGRSASDISAQRQTDPRRLSLILKGDLDWITVRALEKDRTRRYESPAQMAEDLQRYLNHEAIIARPPSLWYRFRKMTGRHKSAVALSMLVLILLVSATVVMAVLMLSARESERFAKLAEAETRAKEKQARTSERLAIESKREADSTLVEMYTAHGLFAAEKGDTPEALLWFVKAASTAGSDRPRRQANLLRFRNWCREIPIPIAATECSFGTVKTLQFHPTQPTLLIHTAAGVVQWDFAADHCVHRSNCSMSISPDGLQTAVARPDGTVEIQSSLSGEIVASFRVDNHATPSIAFSSDGKLLAAGSRSVQIWSTDTRSFLPGSAHHPADVASIQFGLDRSSLVTACFDNTARVFSFSQDGIKNANFPPEEHLIVHRGLGTVWLPPMLLSPSEILLSRSSGALQSWNMSTGRGGKEFRTPLTRPMLNATLNQERSMLAVSFDFSGSVVTFDTNTGAQLTTVELGQARCPAVAFHPLTDLLMLGSHDASVYFCNPRDGKREGPRLQHQGPCDYVTYSRDGQFLASSQFDATTNRNIIRVFQTSYCDERLRQTALSDDLRILPSEPSVDAVSRWIVSSGVRWGSPIRSLVVYDSETGAAEDGVWDLGAEVTATAISPLGDQIAALSTLPGAEHIEPNVQLKEFCRQPGHVHLWNRKLPKNDARVVETAGLPLDAAFSPDGTRLVVTCGNGEVLILESQTGQTLLTLKHSRAPLFGFLLPRRMVRFSNRGDRFLTLGFGNSAGLWTITGDAVAELQHQNTIRDACFSPDDQIIATASEDETVLLWNAGTGERAAGPLKHAGGVQAVRFGKSPGLLATASSDQMVRIWNWQTARMVVPAMEHSGPAYSCDFSESGEFLTSTGNYEMRFWETSTGRELAPRRPLPINQVRNVVHPATGLAVSDGEGRFAVISRIDEFDQAVAGMEGDAMTFAELMSSRRLENEDSTLLDTDEWFQRWNSLDSGKKLRMRGLRERDQNRTLLLEHPRDPLQKIVRLLKEIPASHIGLKTAMFINNQVWESVKHPGSLGSFDKRSVDALERLYERFPAGTRFNTLGVAQFRLGLYERAISSLLKSVEKTPEEIGINGPHPTDLAFLSMCHWNLGHAETAREYETEFVRVSGLPEWSSDHEVLAFASEVQALRQLPSNASSQLKSGLIQIDTFDTPLTNWKLTSARGVPDQISISTDRKLTGSSSLRISATPSPDDLIAVKSVDVSPGTKYRLAAWVRTENVAAAEETTRIAGAYLTLPGRDSHSETVTGTSGWRKIWLDFETGTETQMEIGCRLGHPRQSCTGTAWFDQLELEKTE